MKDINLEIVRKDTKNYRVILKRDGVAVDISGWTVYFTVKTDFNDADTDALISKNYLMPNNSDSQAGIGYLPLSSSDTNIAVGEYVYDMKFIDTNYVETFSRGKLFIIPSIRIN